MADTHRGDPNLPNVPDPGRPVWPGGPSKQGPHRVGSFATCPQLEAFAHDLHLRPIVQKDATMIGTILHVGMAYRYGAMLAEKPDWLIYPDPMSAMATCGAHNTFAVSEAQRLYQAYDEAYRFTDNWQPVLIEHQFEVTMDNEPYTARIDMLAVEDGQYVLIDHKSQARLNAQTGNDYRADRQMLTGLALCRAAGYDVRRVVINAVSKERPPRLMRFDVPISELAYSRLSDDTRFYLQLMQVTRKLYPDPYNRPRNWDACMRKYGICDYWGLCTDGPMRLSEFRKKD